MFPPQVPTTDVSELDAERPVPEGVVLLDVREQDEWDAGHAPDAVHIPLGELPVRWGELDPEVPILVICHSGGRSARAAAWLNQGDFDATNLDGGMVAWSQRGFPVER
ncbi:rhodanese [Oerskovia sp. Root918]|uniref:rhodanese-like domain-containing protein n=1 Tax=unclassified Oerskovia TaxID=2619021 RepID=UPI0006FD9EBB|nr:MULTISPECIES: rhodanese-like domain-containing protein [unclassified Oerskovia]KRC33061.1 rhodanese [Oerskovia sp. Root22]KRD35772.1 rhodanese [Oerskovia sp. Root918]